MRNFLLVGVIGVASCAAYQPGPSLAYVDAMRPAQRIVMAGDRTFVIDSGCVVSGRKLTCGGMTEDLSADQAAQVWAAIEGLPR
jgi:hypothetical protein